LDAPDFDDESNTLKAPLEQKPIKLNEEELEAPDLDDEIKLQSKVDLHKHSKKTIK
jgi:hypothetical protein